MIMHKQKIVKILMIATLLVVMNVRSVPAVPLPGQYAIGTLEAGHLLTARDGGHHSDDALITSATTVGPYEKFTFERTYPDRLLVKTAGGYYVSAPGGGGLGGNYDARQVLQTELTSPADNALFRLAASIPGMTPYTIQTSRNYYLSALGGGGKSSAAFHTDAVKPNGYWESFQVLKCGDLGSNYDYAIKVQNMGYPLQAFGGGSKSAVAFFLQFNSGSTAQRLRLIRQYDGSYALQTSNGVNYISAIGGGGLSGNTKETDNLVANVTHVQDWEKFRIVDRGDCSYSIQTVNKWYLAYNFGRGISTRISDPNAAPSIGYTAYFRFIPFL